MQIVSASQGGTKQYHGARLADGQWMPLTDLSAVTRSFTTTSVSAATVAGELQAPFVTTDNRVLHAIRHTNGSWQNPAPNRPQPQPPRRCRHRHRLIP